MIAIRYTLSQPGTEYRQRLAFALQGAYSSRQYTSPVLEAAVSEFVRSARHRGLSLEWVLVAIQDVIDVGILPGLRDGDRAAFSAPILKLAEEAYGHCHDRLGSRSGSVTAGWEGAGPEPAISRGLPYPPRTDVTHARPS